MKSEKPFNLAEALNLRKAVTKEGKVVTDLYHFQGATDSSYPVRGVVDEDLESWTIKGAYDEDETSNPLDLQNIDIDTPEYKNTVREDLIQYLDKQGIDYEDITSHDVILIKKLIQARDVAELFRLGAGYISPDMYRNWVDSDGHDSTPCIVINF